MQFYFILRHAILNRTFEEGFSEEVTFDAKLEGG